MTISKMYGTAVKKVLAWLAVLSVSSLLYSAPVTLWPEAEDAGTKWRFEGNAAAFEKNGMKFISASGQERPSAILWFPVRPGEKYRFSALLKGENIGHRGHPEHGVAFCFVIRTPEKQQFLGMPWELSGSFDWKKYSFVIEAPEDLIGGAGNFMIGLFNVSGTLYAKEIQVERVLDLQIDDSVPRTMRLMRQIDLGFLVLAGWDFHPYRDQITRNRWNRIRSQLAGMEEQEALRELAGFEDFLLALSSQVIGTPMTPNFLPDWQPDREKSYRNEWLARYADWRLNAETLTRLGLKCSVEDEIARIEAESRKLESSRTVSSPEFDRVAEFYKKIAEERVRLGLRCLELERVLAALESAGKIRSGKSAPPAPPAALRDLPATWRKAYNGGDFVTCADYEKKADGMVERYRKELYAMAGDVAPVRPGASFYSCGVFGFSGNWHTLLNTNVKGTSLWMDGNNEFRPYSDKNFQWEVSFLPTGTIPVGFEQKDGSWVHSERVSRFRNLKSGAISEMQVFWSALAPGVLMNTAEPAVTVADLTAKHPDTPAAVAAVVEGSPRIFRRGEAIPCTKLSENWLLLVWENNAPKIPVLVLFEKKPSEIAWRDEGLEIGNSAGVGRFAAATLYGAVTRPADYGRDWKSLPGEELKQCRTVAALLGCFPLEIDEFFAVENDRVRIWNRLVRAEKLLPDAEPYVPLPPAYTLGLPNQLDLKTEQELSAPLFATKFGFYRVVKGSELCYTLPAPDLLDRLVLKPLRGEETLIDEYNEFILREPSNEWRTTALIDWYGGVFAGLNLMTPEAKKAMDVLNRPNQLDRVVSGEDFYGRCRHIPFYLIPDLLVDPLSGKGAYCAGWRGFRHGFPMKGDMTCFNMQLIQTPLAEAVYLGRWELVERHWERLKRFYSAVDFCQIWQVPGMNTTTSGLIIAGDMYGDGFRSYYLMHRLACGMKDHELAARSLYLAAKQTALTVSLINRNIPAYAAHIHNTGGAERADGELGWLIGMDNHGARAAKWEPFTGERWSAPFQNAGCISYDYPFFGTLLRFLPAESMAWIDDFRRKVPQWSDLSCFMNNGVSIFNAWNTLKFLAFTTRDREAIRKIVAEHMPLNYTPTEPPRPELKESWEKAGPPYHFSSYPMRINAMPHIIAQNDPVWLGDWGRCRIENGTYDRERRIAEIGVSAPDEDFLTVVSMVEPERITVNDEAVIVSSLSPGYVYRVPVKQGVSQVTVVLPEFDFTQFPLPARRHLADPWHLPSAPAPGVFGAVQREEKSLAPGKCTPLKLDALCNQAGNDQEPGAADVDQWNLPRGLTVLRGVPFLFPDPERNNGRTMIMLRGEYRKQYPERIRIPVGRQCRRIYFLHGCCYSLGGKVMTYRLHFEDGQTRDVEIFSDADISDWKIPPEGEGFFDLPNALAIPPFGPARAGQWGKGVGGYIRVWENDVTARGVTLQGVDQHGLARLESIEVISAGRSVPILLAVTLED